MMLRPKDSEGTCIPIRCYHIPPSCFTAQPALRLLRPFRHSSRALVFRESVRPSPYFPSTFASLRELPVFHKQDSNDMLEVACCWLPLPLSAAPQC